MNHELKVILCADNFKIGYLPMLMDQLRTMDVNHELVAIAPPFCWKKKVQAWLDGLGDHKGKAVFIDAFDVLMVGPADELYEKINNPLIFSGDRVCWPDPNLEKLYPDIGSERRFVNSGGLAGYVDELQHFLRIIYEEMVEVYPVGYMDCEQYNMSLHYIKGKGIIDKDCEIFHGLLHDPVGALIRKDSRWQNTQSGALPIFIHGQGKSFKSHPKVFPLMADYQDWNWYV